MADEVSTKKRRRTELACTKCRQRKHRCDGIRPKCSNCQRLRLDCKFELFNRIDKLGRQGHRIEKRDSQFLGRVEDVEAQPVIASPTIVPNQPLVEGQSQSREGNAQLTSFSEGSRTSSSHLSPLRSPPSRQNGLTVNVNDDVAVDVLATATFNEDSGADVGYFGPSSNHSLFRSLSEVFVQTSRLFGSVEAVDQYPWCGLHGNQPQDSAPTHLDAPKPNELDQSQGSEITYSLPRHQDAILLINHYFATIGLVLPYVNKATLVSQYLKARGERPPQFRRAFLALLYIIWALSLSSLGDTQAEMFYQRALVVLDQQCLRGSSLELVQSLLLIITYQQNSQRSITSWTTHALALKAALQLGLHSPAARRRRDAEESELCERLWCGTIFNDSTIGVSLGRPGLVEPVFARLQNAQSEQREKHPPRFISVESKGGHAYLYALASSCTLIASTVELLYNHNIESSETVDAQVLISNHQQLFSHLQKWRETTSEFGGLVSSAELNHIGNGSYDTNRLRILLSIHYYRLLLLINYPVIITFVEMIVEYKHRPEGNTIIPWEVIAIVAKDDWQASNELCGIIQAITNAAEPFLYSNAAWFTCNFLSLTLSLHLFILLLACKHDKEGMLGLSMAEVRSSLEASLENLKGLERSSLMTYKARKCLLKLLQVFDNLRNEDRNTPVSLRVDSYDYLSEYIEQSANEFLFETSQNSFLNSDLGFWGNTNYT